MASGVRKPLAGYMVIATKALKYSKASHVSEITFHPMSVMPRTIALHQAKEYVSTFTNSGRVQIGLSMFHEILRPVVIGQWRKVGRRKMSYFLSSINDWCEIAEGP